MPVAIRGSLATLLELDISLEKRLGQVHVQDVLGGSVDALLRYDSKADPHMNLAGLSY